MVSRRQQGVRQPDRHGPGGGALQALFAGAPPVIPFLTAGFPTRPVFLEAAQAACEAGAGALEIGMPFSDPLADGPAIQHSSQVALEAGVTLAQVLDMAAALRRLIPIPIFLMGYFNPIMRMGLGRFAARAQAAGVAGTIIPDGPLEEAREWVEQSRRHGLANIFLIAPTTPDDRIRRIDRTSTAFSYCVSVAGVTGVRRGVSRATTQFLKRVRRVTRKPFVVGFGIGRPEDIRALLPYADGFVVGSALVPVLERRPQRHASARISRIIGRLVRAAESGGTGRRVR